ncbi:unnamed protein product, partial [Ectocarpus sp. 12 AP-2014]
MGGAVGVAAATCGSSSNSMADRDNTKRPRLRRQTRNSCESCSAASRKTRFAEAPFPPADTPASTAAATTAVTATAAAAALRGRGTRRAAGSARRSCSRPFDPASPPPTRPSAFQRQPLGRRQGAIPAVQEAAGATDIVTTMTAKVVGDAEVA